MLIAEKYTDGGSPRTAMSMSEPGRKSSLIADPKTKTSVAPNWSSKDAAAASALESTKIFAIVNPVQMPDPTSAI